MTDGDELERSDLAEEAPPTRSRRTSPLLQVPVLLALAGKALAGALAALAIVTAWGVWSPTSDFERGLNDSGLVMTVYGAQAATATEVAGWEDTRDYGVLYPLLPGDDADDMTDWLAVMRIYTALASDLYPILDEAGAIYIDAASYQSGVPPQPTDNQPVPSIYVNLNYLAKYPVLGEDGQPIAIDPTETAWVVAIPAKYKDDQDRIEDWIGKLRRGGGGIEGAAQYWEKTTGQPVPEHLRDQQVRIVWMAPDQELFSFDSRVDKYGGNMILDPIVEIMTPANSYPMDRFSSATGPDGALKVFTGGDPEATYTALLPTLRNLGLDDNLTQIVFANEAPLMRLDSAQAQTRISQAAAVTLALVTIALGAASAATIVARLRRVLIVRRLHGFSAARRNRELIAAAAISTLSMLLLLALALATDRAGYAPASWDGIAGGDATAIALRLAAVILALAAVELMLALAIATAVQRRTGALLIKQL